MTIANVATTLAELHTLKPAHYKQVSHILELEATTYNLELAKTFIQQIKEKNEKIQTG